MDSIYKGYPFGTILLWRTKTQLVQERNLGPFMVPEPTADYPIDYVLDGQQRLTSILGVFATDLNKIEDVEWKDIYFDVNATGDNQVAQFLALDPSEVEVGRHFPLNILFNSSAYRAATNSFGVDLAKRVDDLQKRFQKAQFPVSMVETEEIQKIAIVFERINRKGVPLDTFQLLTAWTWSEDFELKRQFEELAGELEPFGFHGVGEDIDLLLRCTAAVLLNKESAESLLTVRAGDVRAALPRVKMGVKGAVDFLKQNMMIQKLDNMPHPTALIPLVAFFEGDDSRQSALTGDQVKILREWFWRTVFSQRYSSGTKRNLEADISEARKLREGNSALGGFDVNISTSTFTERRFNSGTVNTKTFILMLAAQNPRSIVNGARISVGDVLAAGNKSEFHHLYPQAFLKEKQVPAAKINALANYCILSSADNKRVGGGAPSAYRTKLTDQLDLVLKENLIPMELFADDYESFLKKRSLLLVDAAYDLMGRPNPLRF